MTKKQTQSKMASLSAELADLRKHQAELQARLDEIRAIRVQASDPESDALDVGELRKLSNEQAEIQDLLAVVVPRIRAVGGAFREAQAQENAAAVLAMRPQERANYERDIENLRRFVDHYTEHSEPHHRRIAQKLGSPRTVFDRGFIALARRILYEYDQGRVLSQYTDWSGQPVVAAD
jgi:chromosome segregation ATPase